MGQAETRTGKRAALWAAVALIAIAAAGMTGYKIVAERTMSGMIAERGGKVGNVEADFLGRIHLRDVKLPLKDGFEVHIAAIDGRPEIFFLKGMLEVAGLQLKTKLGSVEVPQATVQEANLGYGTMTEIFGGRGDLPLSKRIELFAARRVVAPEILVTQTVGGSEQKLVYRNVVSEGIADGRVSRFSAEGASFEFGVDGNGGEAGGKKRLTGSLGPMTVQDMDAAYLARLYTDKAGPQDKEAKPVYGPSSVKDIVFSDGEARFGYAEIRSSGISMAMTDQPLLETLNALSAVSAPDELPPAERQAYFTRILSIIDMTKKADIEMLGLNMEVPAKDGDKGKKIKFATDRLAIQLDGQTLDATLNGLSMAEGESHFKISEAALSGFSWSPTFKALEQMVALDEQQLESFPFTTLLPEFGTVRLAGIDADLPGSVENGETSPSTAERVRFSLKEYEAALTKPRNGIPTDIRVSYQDLTVPVPANIEEKTLAELRKLGIDELVLSSSLEAAWDEAQQTLVIKEISTSLKDLAGFSFSGVMGGVSGDFFSGDEAKMRVALFGLTAREAELEIEDKGLAAKGLKAYAEQNGMTEDQARGMLTMTSSVVLQQFADEEPRLQDVVDAVSKFIAKPGTFTLTVKSKSPSGLGALELAVASQNPLLLLDRVDIEAVAE
ncbi:hypothetical protein GOC91_01950 [Sinorhizobium medicae]|uniref:hypothetical protein n=1 Tax=Sinorhizobium medicae TaxID=110321 RepID=UPI000FD7E069|nr:hypothetical protein [Sinorhizobium medicae]MDX0624999.1 hypothetical protein [Sinorhizobium medicae]MDX0877383.1 hypothetical protein [Sinorhizobium medicae]MQX45264.1 hypothetical protein [Sinorhizobium medicae]RVH94813.1 hypothetical protein CN201_04735 [Sinorhizobium medicae]RVP67163.1 hypothetical protein CN074_16630 [Sinorhizobium medicae]